jgi:hypothetical protein
MIFEKLNTGYRMPKPKNYPMPDDIYNMIVTCWNKKAEDRPTFQHLYNYLDAYNISSERAYHPL